jgi:hypothetical protein
MVAKTRSGRVAAWTLGASVAATLACSGIAPPSLDGGATAADASVAAPPVVAPPPPPVASPESLFEPLDVHEPAPEGEPPCPEGTSTIHHPLGRELEVYCALGNGKKSGPWSLFFKKRVLATAAYVEGVKEGRATRWSEEEDMEAPSHKLAEEWFKADQRDGAYAEWDALGHLMVRGAYVAGQRDGKFIDNAPGEEGSAPTFGGRCYGAGQEIWSTADAGEFVTRACP